MSRANGMRVGTRRANGADAPRCAEIFLDGRRRASPWQPADRFGLDDYYDCVRDDVVLVAEIDGQVVGFASVDLTERYIRNLFIDRGWQHRGIGTALLREAESCLQGSALLACAARNSAARAFYEHNGWVPVTRPADGEEPHVLYRKAGRAAS